MRVQRLNVGYRSLCIRSCGRVYVFVFVCVYVHGLVRTRAGISVYVSSRVCAYVLRVRACVRVFVCARVRAYVCEYVYACVRVHSHACARVRVYVSTCVCSCAYVYVGTGITSQGRRNETRRGHVPNS